MPYGYIAIIAVIGLALHHVFSATTSLVSKVLVLGVLGVCLACLFWLHVYPFVALFALVGLGIYISLHRIIVQARSSNH